MRDKHVLESIVVLGFATMFCYSSAFFSDHLLWLLESYLDEKDGNALKELEADEQQRKEEAASGGGGGGGGSGSGSGSGGGAAVLNKSAFFKQLIDVSKASTVDAVVAEDLPDLTESVLAKDEFYKTLR